MDVKISELQVSLSAEDLTHMVINYLIENDYMLSSEEPENFDLCNISHDSMTDKIDILFGERLTK